MNLLKKYGLSEPVLDTLSYKSKLGISFKRSLARFDKKEVLKEIRDIRLWYNEQDLLDELALDSRIKSVGSANMKFDKNYPNVNFSSVFNDVLGFRAICTDYDEVLSLNNDDRIRIANMSMGKSRDDGYRGVHIYFQKDNYHYPIEIQFNTHYDRQFNNWLHDKFYKKNIDPLIGRKLRELYDCGKITTLTDFERMFKYVLLDS